MTKEALFDFLLFHAYSKFSGFLVNILGLAVAFMGIILYISDKASKMCIRDRSHTGRLLQKDSAWKEPLFLSAGFFRRTEFRPESCTSHLRTK